MGIKVTKNRTTKTKAFLMKRNYKFDKYNSKYLEGLPLRSSCVEKIEEIISTPPTSELSVLSSNVLYALLLSIQGEEFISIVPCQTWIHSIYWLWGHQKSYKGIIQILFNHIVQKVFFKTFNLASAEAIIQNQSEIH